MAGESKVRRKWQTNPFLWIIPVASVLLCGAATYLMLIPYSILNISLIMIMTLAQSNFLPLRLAETNYSVRVEPIQASIQAFFPLVLLFVGVIWFSNSYLVITPLISWAFLFAAVFYYISPIINSLHPRFSQAWVIPGSKLRTKIYNVEKILTVSDYFMDAFCDENRDLIDSDPRTYDAIFDTRKYINCKQWEMTMTDPKKCANLLNVFHARAVTENDQDVIKNINKLRADMQSLPFDSNIKGLDSEESIRLPLFNLYVQFQIDPIVRHDHNLKNWNVVSRRFSNKWRDFNPCNFFTSEVLQLNDNLKSVKDLQCSYTDETFCIKFKDKKMIIPESVANMFILERQKILRLCILYTAACFLLASVQSLAFYYSLMPHFMFGIQVFRTYFLSLHQSFILGWFTRQAFKHGLKKFIPSCISLGHLLVHGAFSVASAFALILVFPNVPLLTCIQYTALVPWVFCYNLIISSINKKYYEKFDKLPEKGTDEILYLMNHELKTSAFYPLLFSCDKISIEQEILSDKIVDFKNYLSDECEKLEGNGSILV